MPEETEDRRYQGHSSALAFGANAKAAANAPAAVVMIVIARMVS
jgi:hypothetical protein